MTSISPAGSRFTHSLRFRLIGLWLLSLCASLAVGGLFTQLYRQSTAAQIARGAADIARACDLIRDRYGFYATGWVPPEMGAIDDRLRSDLAAVVSVALAREEGVEGGIWQAGAGSLAYAFPTYEGTGPKTDLPAAEASQIESINQESAREEQAMTRQTTARAQTLLLRACPLGGPVTGLTAWTMTRVQAAAGQQPLQLGLGVLFGLMLLMSVWLGRTLLVWGRHVRAIEASLSRGGVDSLAAVARTGERELDRIIDALNNASTRLVLARRQSDAMARRAADAERLAGLGRVAAGVAHEIRNPIAAARLQGENGLAGDDERRRQAIRDMLVQIDRLDGLAAELLAMTQRAEPQCGPIDLPSFLKGQADRHRDAAAAKNVKLDLDTVSAPAVFDQAMVGRALDNLITNAIRHAPEGGTVKLRAEILPGELVLVVEDTGAGIAPDLAGQVFEPFVTGRADGTGLGLAIARELAIAHGGRLMLRRAGGCGVGDGAVFALVLPQETAWPPS